MIGQPPPVQEASALPPGDLASLVLSHAAKNLLTVLLSNLELMDHEPTTPVIQAMATDARDVGQELQQLLATTIAAVRQVPAPQQCVIDQVLKTTIALLTPMAAQHNVVISYHARAALLVPLPPQTVQQIVLNLLLNSLQAFPPTGGQIRVLALPAPQQIILSIHDSGPGLPAPLQQRIFDPAFTTKLPDADTGLGLWIVRQLVQQAGGLIEVSDSRPEHTTFTLRLPRSVSG